MTSRHRHTRLDHLTAPRRNTPFPIESPTTLPRRANARCEFVNVPKSDALHVPRSRSRLPPSMTFGTPYPAHPVYSMLHIHVLGTPHAASSNRHSATRFVARSLPSSSASPQSTPIPAAPDSASLSAGTYVRPLCGLCSCITLSAQCMSDRFCPSIISSPCCAGPRRCSRQLCSLVGIDGHIQSCSRYSTVKRKGSRYYCLGSNILTKVAYFIVR